MRSTKASTLSASARVPKKIVSKAFAVRARRRNGLAPERVLAWVPMKFTGCAAPSISARWP